MILFDGQHWDFSLIPCKAVINILINFYSLHLSAFSHFVSFLFTSPSILPSFRRLVDTEDELSDIQSESVPSEVRDWLASTFTRQMGLMLRRNEEKPRFRSIVHAVQAGIFVER